MKYEFIFYDHMFVVIRCRWTELQAYIHILFQFLYLWLTLVAHCTSSSFFAVVAHRIRFQDETAHLWELCICLCDNITKESVECKFNGRDLHVRIMIMPFITAVRAFLVHEFVSVVYAYYWQPYSFNNRLSFTNIYFSSQFGSDCRTVRTYISLCVRIHTYVNGECLRKYVEWDDGLWFWLYIEHGGYVNNILFGWK